MEQQYRMIFATFALLCCAVAGLSAQIRITGFVTDSLTGERLIGVSIVEIGATNGASSDNNGFFSLQVKRLADIKFTCVGYRPVVFHAAEVDSLMDIRMSSGMEIAAVIVTAQKPQKPGMVSLTAKELHSIPALGGKPDVMKALQLLPGINPRSEGSALLSVRGGNPGENLYLIDNIPLIYVNHLGGWMSVFNPDMINGLDIYKGDFPAMYGGKLSSVIDITQREGSMDGWKGTFSAGITDLSFSAEGPTGIKNTSFIITGRKTLTEALLGMATALSLGNNNILMYGFHDINAKFSWKPDTHNSLHLNLYQGDDYLHAHTKNNSTDGKSRMNTIWGNWLLSARWNRVLKPELFVKNSLSYTRYRLTDRKNYDMTGESFSSRYLSSVQDVSLRSDWKYRAGEVWTVDFGLHASLLTHLPNHTRQSNFAEQEQPPVEKYRAGETAAYTDIKITFFHRLKLHAATRAVLYAMPGFSNCSFEPRLLLDIAVLKNQSFHLGYTEVSQNAHLLFTAGGMMNGEVWVPASRRFPIASSQQYSAGWSGAFGEGMFCAGAEVYYKRLHNLSNYREGYTSLMGDTDWQSKIITGGSGNAKGLEVLFRKTTGRWTGFASWAWSAATRKYPDINGGKRYVYEYDRPHTLSLNLSRHLNDQWTFNMTWVWMSGLPYTPAVGRQLLSYEDDTYLEALIYGERNSARMKPYHRLDFGLSYTKQTRRNRKAEWNIAVYNVYNRRNPYFYYYNESGTSEMYRPGYYDKRNHSMALYQVSFFPLIPTVSYKLYFDRNKYQKYQESRPPRTKKSFGERIRGLLYFE